MTLKEILIEKGIVKIKKPEEEPFILNEQGTTSRIFFDIKEACLDPEILNKIKWALPLPSVLNPLKFDKLGSIAVGGIPIATYLSCTFGIPQVIVRNEIHNRGTKSQVIGNCNGEKILFIEDVCVTGASIIKGIKAIREAGGVCNDCLVIVDREEGAQEACKSEDIRLFSLLKKSDFEFLEKIESIESNYGDENKLKK